MKKLLYLIALLPTLLFGQAAVSGHAADAGSNAPASTGTVTSVGLALPVSVFTVTNSPVTTSGTLTGSFNTQTANTVFAGPTTGVAAVPAFRALVAADIPAAIATVAITDDTTTNATMYPTWVTANTGNLPIKVSSTKFSFNPSTGIIGIADAAGITSAGSIDLAAGGTAKTITVTPSTTGSIALGMAGGGLFKVNYNAVTPATGAKTTGFWYINADSTQNTWTCDAYATNHSWDVRRANGTAASPTAVASGDSISTWNAVGFDGVATYRTGGVLRYKAEETFSTTNNGTSLAFELVPVGSNSRSTAFKVFGGGRTQITPTSMNLAAWGVTGSFLSVGAATYTDSSSSGTVASAVGNSLAVPTFAASSATTFTNAANLYLAGDASAGTNVTLTNSYGIWNVGKTRLDGNALIGTTSTLKFGATAAATIGVSADTTAGIMQFISPTSGTMTFTTANALSATLSGGATATLTGGAGNMTIAAGTGASRTLSLQTTTSGSTATNALVLDATQGATLTGNLTFGTSTSVLNGTTGSVGLTATGTNQNISITPTGQGGVIVSAADASFSPLRVNNTATNSTPQLAQFLAANTTTGSSSQGPYVSWGVANATNNSAVLQFNYIGGSGSATNSLGLGLYGGSKWFLDGSGNVQMTGPITKYNNLTTAGNGVATIQGAGSAVAQTAAATFATYTVGASDADFLVSSNVLVTTSTAHSFTVTCAYTDEGNTARTLTLTFSQLAGTFITAITNVTGAGPYEGVPLHIRAKASTAITIASAGGGTYTTVSYNGRGVITKLQ